MDKRLALEAEMQTLQRLVVSPEDRVQLDVGGHLFSTSAITLRRPGSMLSVLLSGRYQIDRTEDGVAVFLDRDGSLFPHILEYLVVLGVVPRTP
jgi:hypothetical protein